MIAATLAVLALQLPASALLPASSPAHVATVQVAALPPANRADDRAVFADLLAFAEREGLATRPIGEIATAIGMQLRGVPYVAGVLDAPVEETLLAPLDRFDCVLFVESVLALARGVQDGDASYDGYLARVEQQRYRGGEMNGYASRLHYFADWIDDNERRGLVDDVTRDLGGIDYGKRIAFMTSNRASYPRLADRATFAAIADAERALASGARAYVPKNRVRAAYADLQPGDVLATTTDIAGLDVTHVGFAYDAGNGRVGFLHASPGRGVVAAPDLAAYLARNPRQTGLFVARPR